jgi:hypothetical protein
MKENEGCEETTEIISRTYDVGCVKTIQFSVPVISAATTVS